MTTRQYHKTEEEIRLREQCKKLGIDNFIWNADDFDRIKEKRDATKS